MKKKKKKIAIIGAGISGLALGRLTKNHDVKIFESQSEIGGISKVKTIDDVPFHLTGGHCFNSKNKDVLDFVFKEILPKSEWNEVTRDAKIHLKDKLISYPIENAFREMIFHWPLFGIRALLSYLFAKGKKNHQNFESWLRSSFGNILTETYFLPYNKKIWGLEPKEMSTDWLPGKLPERNLKNFLKSFLGFKEKDMVHSTFYYPNKGEGALIKALSNNLSIELNTKIKKIENIDGKHYLNDEYFDEVIYTGPLNLINQLIDCDASICEEIKKLKYNKITTCFWKAKSNDITWSYHPESDHFFHRHAYIGNFLREKKSNYRITECLGSISKEELLRQRDGDLYELIDFHHSDYAYVVYDENTRGSVEKIKKFVKSKNIRLLGRFAEWEYYNMDICIQRAMEEADEINS